MKEELLKLLRNSADFLSGEEIGEKLGVSRSAVWKGIKALRTAGYEISAYTNKGYKLVDSCEVYSEAEIKSRLNTEFVGKDIFCFDVLDSTNNKARSIGYEGGRNGTVVIAESQTAGKGRRGHSWTSPEGTGIWMSILVRPDTEPSNVPSITLITGISVCDAINKLYNINAGIKWPNDILVKSKKICGILTEMASEVNYVNFVVVGIGINANIEHFPDRLSDIATSVMIETGAKIDRSRLAASVIEEFEKNYKTFLEKGFNGLKAEYEKRCVTLNKPVKVSSTETYNGRAMGVTDKGLLIVEKETGETVELIAGDVSIREVQ